MDYQHIQVSPLTPTIGAMVEGVDLNDVKSDDVFAEIEHAVWHHHVIFFRDQPLTTEAHLALAGRFGEVTGHEFMDTDHASTAVQRIEHSGYAINPTARWHTDVSFRERPMLVAVLRAVELPPAGGDTVWCSTGAAFDALPDPMKTMLLGLDAEHDFAWQRRLKWTGEIPDDLERWLREIKETPYVVHPSVITHPVTGRLTLFINSNWTKKFVGVDLDLSASLIAMLWEWVKRPEFQVRFRWEKDSVAIWDNLGTQHAAVVDYEPHFRSMRRVIAGAAKPSLDLDKVPAHLRPPAPAPRSIGQSKADAA